ncbi:MAG TPA: hypothetical protein VK469_13165 [Candidatus Kapabacteria bacterium]|nr:hypothetical protein [Candidatus Kapabacteria bacterium]
MKSKSTTIFSIIFVLVLGVYEIAHGAIVANDLADPYPGGKMIEANVIDGAAFFFQAQINISALFLEGENGSKDKLNFGNCITNIDAAIGNLKLAQERMLAAAATAKTTIADENKIAILKGFDYDKLTSEKRLVKEIMQQVKLYLAQGNIPGFYQAFANGLDDMINHLQMMRDKLAANNQPTIDDFWYLLNRSYYIGLFGNYGTVVGQTALKY